MTAHSIEHHSMNKGQQNNVVCFADIRRSETFPEKHFEDLSYYSIYKNEKL